MSMTIRGLACLGPHGFHQTTYAEWAGPPGGRTTICVHGLTRNGRDFDALAAALAATHRVVCPDVVGRGRSAWLEHAEDYGYALYLADMAALIARLDVAEVDWVGTSMGGLIGMMLAAQPRSPVRRLVVNDVGPLVPKSALERIGAYVGEDPSFGSRSELEAYLRRIHAPFGTLSDAQWRHLAEHSSRIRPDGRFGLAYDPAIGAPFKGEQKDVELWPVWDVIRCPTLVLRGAGSDLLQADVATAMAARGPHARIVEFAGAGHAPALMDEAQISVIRNFLTE